MQTDAELAERSFDAECARDPDGPVTSADRAMTSGGVMAKHVVDFASALLGVICLLPVIGLVALLIKLDSAGPVFFRQSVWAGTAKRSTFSSFGRWCRGPT